MLYRYVPWYFTWFCGKFERNLFVCLRVCLCATFISFERSQIDENKPRKRKRIFIYVKWKKIDSFLVCMRSRNKCECEPLNMINHIEEHNGLYIFLDFFYFFLSSCSISLSRASMRTRWNRTNPTSPHASHLHKNYANIFCIFIYGYIHRLWKRNLLNLNMFHCALALARTRQRTRTQTLPCGNVHTAQLSAFIIQL